MYKRLNIFLIFYVAMILLFIFNKWLYVQNNNSYEGKITSISATYVSHNDNHGTGKVYYPYIEYYKGKDTLTVSNKGWNCTFLDEGDNVTVIVNNEDESVIELKTLFNFWMPVHIIVILFFIGFIGCASQFPEHTS